MFVIPYMSVILYMLYLSDRDDWLAMPVMSVGNNEPDV